MEFCDVGGEVLLLCRSMLQEIMKLQKVFVSLKCVVFHVIRINECLYLFPFITKSVVIYFA